MGSSGRPRRTFVIHLFAGLAASTACRHDAATNASPANPDVAPAIVPARGADASVAAREAGGRAVEPGGASNDADAQSGAAAAGGAASDADAGPRADASNDASLGAAFGVAGIGRGVGSGSRMGSGTIGLGNIGTIGGNGGRMGSGTIGLGAIGVGMSHASGTSSGYGHGAGGTAGLRMGVPSPQIRAMPPTVNGMMAPEVIRRVVLRNFGQVRACYEPALAQNPRLAGRVVIHFVIGPAGAVTDSSVAQAPPPLAQVAACIATAFHRFVFPAPDVGSIIVNYPMQLEPAPH